MKTALLQSPYEIALREKFKLWLGDKPMREAVIFFQPLSAESLTDFLDGSRRTRHTTLEIIEKKLNSQKK